MNKPSILITGGAGMIGYHLIKELNQIYGNFFNLIVLDCIEENNVNEQYSQERISYIKAFSSVHYTVQNLLKPSGFYNILKLFNPFVIVHLSALTGVSQGVEFPGLILTHNQQSFLNLIENVRIFNPLIPIIYASSSAVYGNNNNIVSAETDPTFPLSSYGLSKILNEQTAKLYSTQYGMNFIGLRFFTSYGEYNRKDMLIFKLLESICFEKPVTLYNNGEMHRDFTYCGDIAKIIYYFIEQAFEYNIIGHNLYNVGNSESVSLNAIVDILTHCFNKSPNIILSPLIPQHAPTITYCNNQKLLQHLENNFSFTNITHGLEIMCEWYKNK